MFGRPYFGGRYFGPRYFGAGVDDVARAGLRTTSWEFTFDGHQFYVLDLGQEGTFLYDTLTEQWCRFKTYGWDVWNFRTGATWGTDRRIVGADTLSQKMWEISPGTLLDEDEIAIRHAATGGLMTRSRVFHSVEALRVAGSWGKGTSPSGATIQLRFSDDNGNTWVDCGSLDLTEGDYSGEVAWRSLGSFAAPGRVFEITDVGGMLRIDGVDAMIDNFDEQGG